MTGRDQPGSAPRTGREEGMKLGWAAPPSPLSFFSSASNSSSSLAPSLSSTILQIAMSTAESAAPPSEATPSPSVSLSNAGAQASSPLAGQGEKRAELRMTMLKKLRPYPLRHEWVFWHERNDPAASETSWEDQLKEIAQISTVQSFWQVFNNTPFTTLPLRDSLHLFKKNVKPIWEDTRNMNGGAWTFRIQKTNSLDFWKEVLMAAIGEVLQEVVEKGDDICGVSISVRFNSHLIMVWNRDGSNEKSIEAIKTRVLDSLPEELKPQPQNIYYKKHSSHASFKGSGAGAGDPAAKPATETPKPTV